MGTIRSELIVVGEQDGQGSKCETAKDRLAPKWGKSRAGSEELGNL